jgi:hypothetical protein
MGHLPTGGFETAAGSRLKGGGRQDWQAISLPHHLPPGKIACPACPTKQKIVAARGEIKV